MKKFKDKPMAFVSLEYKALDNLKAMIDCDDELYDECLNTMNFAFHFGQIANKAVHFDYLVSMGFIPESYLND